MMEVDVERLYAGEQALPRFVVTVRKVGQIQLCGERPGHAGTGGWSVVEADDAERSTVGLGGRGYAGWVEDFADWWEGHLWHDGQLE